ncbi:MAG TPA: FAD-dependent oxidoreductase [Haliscomenobacter sp.]|nr:FAD-dependent oxidoreductase [Haliscomenobacter sp.]
MKQQFAKQIQRSFNRALRQVDPVYFQHRRGFLRQFAGLSTGVLLGQSLLPDMARKTSVLVVGAGIAGLNAAHQLKKAGIEASVYEASNRYGGRMMTLRNYFGPGLTTELGGEFIDAYHEDMLSLAKEFKLEIYDLREDEPTLQESLYFVGKQYTEDDLAEAIQPFIPKFRASLEKLPEDFEQLSYRDAANWQELDQLSIPQYLDSIGVQGWLKQFYHSSMSAYYTMDAAEQSVINLFLLLGLPEPGHEHEEQEDLAEIFKIRGGSQALTEALGKSLEAQIKLGHALSEIKKHADGTYTAVFEHRGKLKSIKADYLILALPFTKLREVKTTGFAWSPVKAQCIRELGYGNGGKILFGLNERVWRKHGSHGGFNTDFPAYSGWDSSRMQAGELASLTVFGGSNIGHDAAQLNSNEILSKYMPGLDQLWPGFKAASNGKMHKFSWESYPFNLGSYTAYKPGQWSSFGGIEKEPEGNIFFAGEHCSVVFQGYMNGGAYSGRVAAESIIEKLKS